MLYIGIALHGTECWVDITYHPSHTHTDVYTSLFFVHELLCSLGQVVFCLCMYCIWCTHTHDQSGPAWMRFSCFLLFLLLTFVRLTVRCEREHGWMVKIGENANINTWNIICKEKRKKRWAISSSSSRGSGAEVPAARYHWNGHRNMLRTPKNCPTLNASINYLIIIVRFTSFFSPLFIRWCCCCCYFFFALLLSLEDNIHRMCVLCETDCWCCCCYIFGANAKKKHTKMVYIQHEDNAESENE